MQMERKDNAKRRTRKEESKSLRGRGKLKDEYTKGGQEEDKGVRGSGCGKGRW